MALSLSASFHVLDPLSLSLLQNSSNQPSYFRKKKNQSLASLAFCFVIQRYAFVMLNIYNIYITGHISHRFHFCPKFQGEP